MYNFDIEKTYKSIRRPKDLQKSRLYQSEREVYGDVYEVEPDFKSLEECLDFLSQVVKNRWIKAKYPAVETIDIELRPGRGSYTAKAVFEYKEDGTHQKIISLPKVMRRKWVILHELAHHLQPDDSAAHGWEYAGIYHYLTYIMLGKEQSDELAAAFRRNKVKYRSSGAKSFSDEYRQRLRERMEGINSDRRARGAL